MTKEYRPDVPNIGQLIKDGETRRDAIHIAVAPVTAAHCLSPGEPIGFVYPDNSEYVGLSDSPVGIADPYLSDGIEKGDRFWMFLYPGTITGMRHVWQHPAFKSHPGSLQPPEKFSWTKEQSEQWLREFVETHSTPRYETLMAAIKGELLYYDTQYYSSRCIIDEEYFHFNGYDAHGEIPLEFWLHVENVLGYEVNPKPGRFSCSC